MVKREIVTSSVSASVWKDGFLQTGGADQPWSIAGSENATTVGARVLQDGVIVKVKPERKRFYWNASHFHDKFQIEPSSSSWVLLFQAKARESVSVAVSTKPDFSKDCLYEIHFGAVENTTTILKQRTKGTKPKSTSISSRVCSGDSWISYWICLYDNNKLYAGVGDVPGRDCVGVMDVSSPPKDEDKDDADMKEETAADEETNSSEAKPMDEPSSEPTVAATKPVMNYIGLGNSAKGPKSQPLGIQNVAVTNSLPSFVAESLSNLPSDLPVVVVDGNEDIKKMMEDYKQECQRRKARAEKFGTAYKEPEPEAFLPWSKAKRLRENPEKGFVTGLDVMDPEEVAKREARKARFGITENNIEDDDKTKKANYLPVTQAWDKEEMLRPQRKDPPPSMWEIPSSDEERDPFAMEPREQPTLEAEKIHLFAIDWAAFKQIRNKDLMSYFSIYGPSYVEWMGDLSCNVCFEDMHTATRAMMNLSQEIPSPPPPEVQKGDDYQPPDFGNMKWRFCVKPIRKVANDKYGRQNTTARVLMRKALSTDTLEERPNSWPAPPGGFSSTKVLGPDSDYRKEGRKQKRQRGGKNSKPLSKEKVAEQDDNATGEHPLLSRGLSAGRGGFSVEELEKERASKRAKHNENAES